MAGRMDKLKEESIVETPTVDTDDPVELLWRERPAAREATIKLLHKIEGNILKSPENPKFRRIHVVKIMKKLQGEAILKLLTKAGFLYTPEGEWLHLPPDAELGVLTTVLESVRNRVQKEKQKEIDEREAILAQQRDAQKRRRAADQRERERLRKEIAQSKAERKDLPKPGQSRATERKFGRTDVEVKFNNTPAKGGG